MSKSLLADAFRHHVWATERLLEVCASLTAQQLAAPFPGTFGPIIDTLRHVVGSDGWYLWNITGGKVEGVDEESMDIEELRAAVRTFGAAWEEVLALDLDPDADIVRTGEGWEFHAPLGLRLAQAIHHGTDHRSQVCTALTSLSIEPPMIDLWDWGEATRRTWTVGERPPD